jgi:hypothetical protein
MNNWLAQHHLQSKWCLKRIIYFFLRPLYSQRYSRFLTPETIEKCRPRWVLGSRGMPLETRRRWGAKYLPNLRHATLLVQGTGTGWDVISWARLRPRRIIATDMFPFEESWQEIARYCLDRYRVPVEFRTALLEDHGPDGENRSRLCALSNPLPHVQAEILVCDRAPQKIGSS